MHTKANIVMGVVSIKFPYVLIEELELLHNSLIV